MEPPPTSASSDRWIALAHELGGPTQSLRTSWTVAIQRMSSTSLAADDVERLARLSPTPASLSDFAGMLKADANDRLNLLKAAVDDSPYSLKEWICSLNILHSWATTNGKEAQFQNMLGYIHCCTQADSSRPLTDVVESMLEEFGYSGGAE